MNQPRPQDQLRDCERCGITFLYSAEEQAAARADAAPPPTHCPGCRLLLPPPGIERGLVKWYNFKKRYGFIIRRGQPEIFAHGAEIVESRGLHPGDLVEFSVGHNARGRIATAIRVLAPGEPPIAD